MIFHSAHTGPGSHRAIGGDASKLAEEQLITCQCEVEGKNGTACTSPEFGYDEIVNAMKTQCSRMLDNGTVNIKGGVAPPAGLFASW